MFFLLFNYVQVMVRGCPLGFTPAFNTTVALENAKGCESGSDCPAGAECMFSPISPVYLCCRQDFVSTTSVPMDDVLAVYLSDAVTAKSTTSTTRGSMGHSGDESAAKISIVTAAAAPVHTDVSETARVATGPGLSGNILVPLPGVWPRLPDVRPILVGRLLPLPSRPNVWQRYGSVTLVRDNGYNILVDTGSGPRQNDVKAGLASLGVTPAQIDVVVLSHGHPDHFGNNQLFPLAQFLYGSYLFKGEEFLSYGLHQAQTVKLTDHTEVWSTPGHTQDSITVVVKNVPYGGVVAITGDLFLMENDLDDPGIWINSSTNANLQLESRKFVICRVNWIIPGHDKLFKVTNATRIAAGCTSQTPEPSIPFPQLPQQSTYEEQNAIRYAYYAYNIVDRVSSSSPPLEHAHPGANLVLMNDHSGALLSNAPHQHSRPYVAQSQPEQFPQQHQLNPPSSFVLNQEIPGRQSQTLINQKQPQLSVVQQQQPVVQVASPGYAIPGAASAGACCILAENQLPQPKKFPAVPVAAPSPWQPSRYQAVSYTGEGGLPPLPPSHLLYRNGKN